MAEIGCRCKSRSWRRRARTRKVAVRLAQLQSCSLLKLLAPQSSWNIHAEPFTPQQSAIMQIIPILLDELLPVEDASALLSTMAQAELERDLILCDGGVPPASALACSRETMTLAPPVAEQPREDDEDEDEDDHDALSSIVGKDAPAYHMPTEKAEDAKKEGEGLLEFSDFDKGEEWLDELCANIQAGEPMIADMDAAISTATADLETAIEIRDKMSDRSKKAVDDFSPVGRTKMSDSSEKAVDGSPAADRAKMSNSSEKAVDGFSAADLHWVPKFVHEKRFQSWLAKAGKETAQAARLKGEEEKKNATEKVHECSETCICGRAFHFCVDGRGKECFDCGEVIVALSRVMYCCTCNLTICSDCYV